MRLTPLSLVAREVLTLENNLYKIDLFSRLGLDISSWHLSLVAYIVFLETCLYCGESVFLSLPDSRISFSGGWDLQREILRHFPQRDTLTKTLDKITFLINLFDESLVPRYLDDWSKTLLVIKNQFLFNLDQSTIDRSIASNKQTKVYEFLVEITDACNTPCLVCESFACKDNVTHVPVSAFKQLLSYLRTLVGDSPVRIRLGGGEPFLHPEFSDIVRAAREAFPEGGILALTNGVIFTRPTSPADERLSAVTENKIGLQIFPSLETNGFMANVRDSTIFGKTATKMSTAYLSIQNKASKPICGHSPTILYDSTSGGFCLSKCFAYKKARELNSLGMSFNERLLIPLSRLSPQNFESILKSLKAEHCSNCLIPSYSALSQRANLTKEPYDIRNCIQGTHRSPTMNSSEIIRTTLLEAIE
jgi:hypothetical protein